MSNDYQITPENLGKQTTRTAAALLALMEFDAKMGDYFAHTDEIPDLTKAQKNKLKKAVGEMDMVSDAVLNIRDQMKTILAAQ